MLRPHPVHGVPQVRGDGMSEVCFDTRAGGIGDMVTLAWLAEGYKAAGISCFFDNTEVKPGHREVLEVLGQTLTSAPCSIPMQSLYHYEVNVTRGTVPRVEAWARLLPDRPTARRPQLLRSQDVNDGLEFARDAVVLFPNATWRPREWPQAHWLDLAWLLKERGFKVVGLSSDGGTVKRMPHYAVGMNWRWLAGACVGAAAVVGNDSGPVHVAATVNPGGTVMLAGPTRNVVASYGAEEWGGPRACDACYFEAGRGFRAACDEQCRSLMELTPEVVCARIEARIRGASARPGGEGRTVQLAQRRVDGGGVQTAAGGFGRSAQARACVGDGHPAPVGAGGVGG